MICLKSETGEMRQMLRQVLSALGYYAPTSRPVRQALSTFTQACREAGFDCDPSTR